MSNIRACEGSDGVIHEGEYEADAKLLVTLTDDARSAEDRWDDERYIQIDVVEVSTNCQQWDHVKWRREQVASIIQTTDEDVLNLPA